MQESAPPGYEFEDTPSLFTGADVRDYDDDMPMAHFALAFEGLSWTHPDIFTLMLCQTLLGFLEPRNAYSATMSAAPLSANLAKAGLASTMQPFCTCYKDTGLFGVYFVSDTRDKERAYDLCHHVQEELVAITPGCSDEDVARGTAQLKFQLLQQMDGTSPTCEEIGRQLLTYGRRMSLAETFARIDAIDASDVERVADAIIWDQEVAFAAVGSGLEERARHDRHAPRHVLEPALGEEGTTTSRGGQPICVPVTYIKSRPSNPRAPAARFASISQTSSPGSGVGGGSCAPAERLSSAAIQRSNDGPRATLAQSSRSSQSDCDRAKRSSAAVCRGWPIMMLRFSPGAGSPPGGKQWRTVAVVSTDFHSASLLRPARVAASEALTTGTRAARGRAAASSASAVASGWRRRRRRRGATAVHAAVEVVEAAIRLPPRARRRARGRRSSRIGRSSASSRAPPSPPRATVFRAPARPPRPTSAQSRSRCTSPRPTR